jgi:hypothetical protein
VCPAALPPRSPTYRHPIKTTTFTPTQDAKHDQPTDQHRTFHHVRKLNINEYNHRIIKTLWTHLELQWMSTW